MEGAGGILSGGILGLGGIFPVPPWPRAKPELQTRLKIASKINRRGVVFRILIVVSLSSGISFEQATS